MGAVRLIIDGVEVEADSEATVLTAALKAGIYIPHLCFHPDLPPSPGLKPQEVIYRGRQSFASQGSASQEFEGCQLCLVEIRGMEGYPQACHTPVVEEMVVHTDTPELRALRRDNLMAILAHHPHACLTCAQREGCSRTQCSTNVPEEERCCPKLGHCEVQKVAEYIGIKEETPRWLPTGLPVLEDEPLLRRDYNLCIGCLRCLRACNDLRGVGALGFVFDQVGKAIVGTVAPTLAESGCRFCTACVAVCPTGALMDKLPLTDMAPCSQACPAEIDVPRYLRLIAQGRYAEAAAVIREKVPFPAVLGRICFRPCEEECRRQEIDEPLAICGLKRFAAEVGDGSWKGALKPARPTGKRVAIVGSGPAGLTAAYYLARLGHGVTVFDSQPEAGGMLRWGVPEYRLPREVLQREIEDIVEQGVEVRTGATVEVDLTLDDLRHNYDALFLAPGAHLARKLDIEGADLEGVLWGLDLLRDVRLGREMKVKERAVVIGGGGVAVDVALTALRLGAQEVTLACLECREEMPAQEWEIEEALEEGVKIHPSWGPKRILGRDGQVAGIELVRCTSVFDERGRFNPSFDEAILTSLETNMVILAIGQATDLSLLGEGGPIKAERGLIQVDPQTLETDMAGVFAGGEATSGPSSVIEAIAIGRQAAISIDKYLGGKGDIAEALVPVEKPNPWLGREEGFAARKRAAMPSLPLSERRKGFAEVWLGLEEGVAREEAKRCLQCDLRFLISSVPLPPERWLSFEAPQVALVPEVAGVLQLLDEGKKVISIRGVMNIRQALEEELTKDQRARYFHYEEEEMYTKRESELIQQHLQRYGELPGGGMEELEDLF